MLITVETHSTTALSLHVLVVLSFSTFYVQQ